MSAYLHSEYLRDDPREIKTGMVSGEGAGVPELGGRGGGGGWAGRGLRIRRRIASVNIWVYFQLFFM